MPEKSAELREQHGLAFPILSDPGNGWARELSLTYGFPDDLKGIYVEFGIDLPSFNGDDSWELPIPARIVVGSDGRIRSLDADPDYTRRPEPEATLEVLRSLA